MDPVTTSQHRSSTGRSIRWRPVRAAYECQTHFPNLRQTLQKLRRGSDPWATAPCPHVASSTCLLSNRIRPTPSHQQVFRRLGPKPRGSGPTMAEVRKVGRSDWVRLWRIQNRGDSSRSTILHQDPRYFPSRKRNFGARVWYSTTRVVITKNDSGDNTFNTSEFLALCSPVRYKMPTTQDMTGLSGIP
jgi:hypothetical protein